MAGELITVTGLGEVQRALAEAPRLIVANAYLKALQAAANVIEQEVAIRTPERDEGSRNEDDAHLIDGLMTAVELDSQFRGGVAMVGFGKQGHKAMWVEFGHRMVGHKPGKKQLGQVAARPFMRPAADASANKAIEAFADSLAESLKAGY
jgi:HK97 gp10 family phage protein